MAKVKDEVPNGNVESVSLRAKDESFINMAAGATQDVIVLPSSWFSEIDVKLASIISDIL